MFVSIYAVQAKKIPVEKGSVDLYLVSCHMGWIPKVFSFRMRKYTDAVKVMIIAVTDGNENTGRSFFLHRSESLAMSHRP